MFEVNNNGVLQTLQSNQRTHLIEVVVEVEKLTKLCTDTHLILDPCKKNLRQLSVQNRGLSVFENVKSQIWTKIPTVTLIRLKQKHGSLPKSHMPLNTRAQSYQQKYLLMPLNTCFENCRKSNYRTPVNWKHLTAGLLLVCYSDHGLNTRSLMHKTFFASLKGLSKILL